jgi:CRP/FNR family transcriptional regulator
MRAVNLFHPISSNQALTSCPNCGFLDLLARAAVSARMADKLGEHITHNRLLPKRSCIGGAGLLLTELPVVRTGLFKTILSTQNGTAQVTGFSMPGDVVGMDAIADGKYVCSAIALEASSVCAISFAALEKLCGESMRLHNYFLHLLSSEISRNREMILLLGMMAAEERLAVFLLDFSERGASLGFSPPHLRLPMSRDDIGSYLGLALATVSRLFSKFRDERIIEVDGKDIHIKDLAGLKRKSGIARNNDSNRSARTALYERQTRGDRASIDNVAPHDYARRNTIH